MMATEMLPNRSAPANLQKTWTDHDRSQSKRVHPMFPPSSNQPNFHAHFFAFFLVIYPPRPPHLGLFENAAADEWIIMFTIQIAFFCGVPILPHWIRLVSYPPGRYKESGSMFTLLFYIPVKCLVEFLEKCIKSQKRGLKSLNETYSFQ